MNVFITGASGLVGRRLVSLLESAGHTVIKLVRDGAKDASERPWSTGNRRLNASILDGCDALIHLAGESIAALRWTQAKKYKIYESRITTTSILADAVARMEQPPACVIVASAVGYYGSRGKAVLTETSGPGTGFLSEVCQDWEQAADPIRSLTRVVHVRTGMVLSRQGGALKSMLPAFSFGLGGTIGSGRQYWSWISLDDIASLYLYCVETSTIQGAVNGVSPKPATNREFTRQLARSIHRPALLPVPSLAIKLLIGEMGRELLLSSTRVIPQVAVDHGFQFQHPTLADAFAVH